MGTSSKISFDILGELPASFKDIEVADKFVIPTFSHIEYDIKDILALKSQKAFSTQRAPIWIGIAKHLVLQFRRRIILNNCTTLIQYYHPMFIYSSCFRDDIFQKFIIGWNLSNYLTEGQSDVKLP